MFYYNDIKVFTTRKSLNCCLNTSSTYKKKSKPPYRKEVWSRSVPFDF